MISQSQRQSNTNRDQNEFTQEESHSPERVIRFREKQHAKKFTTPIQTSGLNHLAHNNDQDSQQIPQSNNQSFHNAQILQLQAQSPSAIKVIDLRNPQVRKLVMDSLNEIIEARKKPPHHHHNANYQNIVQSTPQTLRVQNSIDDGGSSSGTVLIERGSHPIPMPSIDQQSQGSSNPPSRIDQQNSNGILRMSPRSQSKFFSSLQKIYQDQQDISRINSMSEFIEEPNSPEYTIVQALDDSCVLFAIKENLANNFSNDEQLSGQDSAGGRADAHNLQSPTINRNFYDQEGNQRNDPAEMMQQLAIRLETIQEDQDNNIEHPLRRAQRQPNYSAGLVESYSTDRQFLMIHPQNLKKLTPTLKAPQISRQPSIQNIDFFDLSVPSHAEILCQRLQDLRNIEDEQALMLDESSSVDAQNMTRNSHSNSQLMTLNQVSESSGVNSQTKTPLPTRGPPSRNDAQAIDIDLLIAKLLEIPNDELLDSLLNLSLSAAHQTETEANQVTNFQQQTVGLQSHQQQGRDSESDLSSSGIQTPGSNSFSTPIQAKLYFEKGTFQLIKPAKGLDLRSPHTKFNLMRKLQEVKEELRDHDDDDSQSSVADEDPTNPTYNHHHNNNSINHQQQNELINQAHLNIAGQPPSNQLHSLMNMMNYDNSSNNNYSMAPLILSRNQKQPREILSVNDFSRMFINEEEDEEDSGGNEDDEEDNSSSSQPTSFISPQRSLNSTMITQQLQIRQQMPQIELLIQKLKKLEQKRMKNAQSLSSGYNSSEAESPQKIESISRSGGSQVTMIGIGANNNGNAVGNSGNGESKNLLEQVIKRLERLKRSRDSSV